MADNKAKANEFKDQGNAALQQGNFSEAISLYTEGITLDPENHVLYSNRSAAYAKMEKYTESLEDAEKTISIKPDWAKGYSRKGAALSYMGNKAQAMSAYKKGLKLEPDNQQIKDAINEVKAAGFQAFLQKMAADPRTRHMVASKEYLDIARDIYYDPGSLANHFNERKDDPNMMKLFNLLIQDTMSAEDLMEEMEVEEAEPGSPKSARPEPQQPEPPKQPTPSSSPAQAEKELGNAAYKLRNFEKAIEHYNKASQLDPNDMTFLNNLAAVYFEQKRYEECIAQCEKAIEVGRENRADFKMIAKSYAREASAYVKLKDYQKAKYYYEKSLAEHRTPETRAKLSEVEKIFKEEQERAYVNPEISLEEKAKGNDFFTKGDYPQAIKHYAEAIRRNPQDAKLFSNRAACYTKLAEFQMALRDCDECIRLDPNFVKGYIRKAAVLLALKDHAKAGAAYQKAIELDPNCQEAIDGYRKCHLAANSDPEEVRRRAMGDPEVQAILKDPAMRLILEQMQEDPKALSDHLKNPEVAAKIQKLMESGLIAIR